MSVSVRVDDSRLQAWISREQQREAETLALFQEQGSQMAVEEMRGQVPIRSGFLRESITRHFTPVGFSVYPTASYAGFVDRGTGPHEIFPVSAKALRFETAGGGVVFARRVMHPGSAGRFFVQRTAEALRGRLAELLRTLTEVVYRE